MEERKRDYPKFVSTVTSSTYPAPLLSLSSWSEIDEDDFSLLPYQPPPKRGKTASSIALLARYRKRKEEIRECSDKTPLEVGVERETCMSPLSTDGFDHCNDDGEEEEEEAYCCRLFSDDSMMIDASVHYCNPSSIANVTNRSIASSQEDDFSTTFSIPDHESHNVERTDGSFLERSATKQNYPSLVSAATVPSSCGPILSELPEDILFRITSFLDAESLLLSFGCVNRYFSKLSREEAAGWRERCLEQWRDKCHIAASARDEFDKKNSIVAYRLALEDSRVRQHVTESEFCYDPETEVGTVWSFRFKAAAGSDWTSFDPWYSGLPCRKMVFLRNGTVKEAIPLQQNKDSDSCCYTTDQQRPFNTAPHQEEQFTLHSNNQFVLSNLLDERQHQDEFINRQQQANSQVSDQSRASYNPTQIVHDHEQIKYRSFVAPQELKKMKYKYLDPPMPMTWRFISRPMDLPTRLENGSYVRFTVAGRDVPTYAVSRSPTGNWGFIMESCWGLYGSFELPPLKKNTRPINNFPSTGILTRSRTRQRPGHAAPVLRRRPQQQEGALWIQDVEDDDDSVDSENSDESEESSNLQDDTLLLTNEIQWREAFLYNVGARILPEGDEAMQVFDQAWGGMHR